MLLTTKKLLTRLEAVHGVTYRIREAELLGDSEFIYLTDDCVLSIEEDEALPTISLVELMNIGGNVEIDGWVVTDDTVIDEAVAAAFTALVEPLSESQKKSAELQALIDEEQRYLWRPCDQ